MVKGTEKEITEFIRGYVEAMLWASTDDDGKPLDLDYSASDIDLVAMEDIRKECIGFISDNYENLLEYVRRIDNVPEYSTAWDYAGHYFFLTRNHHGTGFWDIGLETLGDELANAAHSEGEQSPYVGDDHKIYI